MFKELFESNKDYKNMKDQDIQKDMLMQSNKIGSKFLEPNEYIKFDGLEKGKIGVIVDPDSDFNEWKNAPEYIIWDKNKNAFEISFLNGKETKPELYDLAWKRFEQSFKM